jgi:hypothetical protein
MAEDKPQEPQQAAPAPEEQVEADPVESAEPPEQQDATDDTQQPADGGEEDVPADGKEAEAAPEPEPEPEPGSLNDMTPEELEEARANEVAFSWQASEYVHHHKGVGWYAGLAGAIAVLILILALLRYWLQIAVFVAMGIAIFVYAKKPPRTLMYELTPKGITIEGKQYPFSNFRSFGVLKDEEYHTIDLEPVKRFSPRINILFNPDDLESIVGHLELHLPRTDREPDIIEKASRYLRF